MGPYGDRNRNNGYRFSIVSRVDLRYRPKTSKPLKGTHTLIGLSSSRRPLCRHVGWPEGEEFHVGKWTHSKDPRLRKGEDLSRWFQDLTNTRPWFGCSTVLIPQSYVDHSTIPVTMVVITFFSENFCLNKIPFSSYVQSRLFQQSPLLYSFKTTTTSRGKTDRRQPPSDLLELV